MVDWGDGFECRVDYIQAHTHPHTTPAQTPGMRSGATWGQATHDFLVLGK